MSQKYSEEYYSLKAELEQLTGTAIRIFENAGGRAQKFVKLIDRYADFTDLTPTILNEFISRIEVHERDKKRAKQAIQHIGIYFNHIGRFENELTQLAEPTEQEIRQMREEIEEARKEKSRAYHRNYSREYRARNLAKEAGVRPYQSAGISGEEKGAGCRRTVRTIKQNSNIIEGFSELREIPLLRPEKGVTY